MSRADDDIVREAKDRLKRCRDWESTARPRQQDDQKFVEGDSENLYQWDDRIYKARTAPTGGGAPRPCLTINKVRQHCLQIVNEARQNKASIQIHATGGGATYESAQAFEDVVRHIEYQSNATEAYEAAIWHQVTGGVGYVRVITDYADADSFDQEIYIRRIKDPFTVYLDPDIEEFDGSDARFGFVVKQVPRDEFEKDYPSLKDKVGTQPLDDGNFSWADDDHVFICEYYRRSQKADRLVAARDPDTGELKVAKKSELPEEIYAALKDAQLIERERDVLNDEVEWFKIVGGEIVDRSDWPGKYVPLVRFVGEETTIDGVLDRHGHVRALKDAQRMYNYNTSSAVEHVALQTKVPWVLPVESVEGLEGYWNSANVENHAYLPYNGNDDQGRPLAPPQRNAPPAQSAAYLEGMRTAQQEMMMASGQYQSQFGENENAKSGIAIQTRQRQGDNATYHYIDHQAQAIKFVGRIIVDLIPHIYDTQRVVKIMAEDGTQTEVTIDPKSPKAQQQMVNGQPVSPEQFKQAQKDENLKSQVQTIFNPKVGKYDVQVDVGPAFATRREEAVNSLMQLMSANKEMVTVAGDILLRNMDFPDADKVAERLEKMLPPQISGDGPPPQVQHAMQEAQQQMQALQGMLSQMAGKLNEAEQKLKDKDAEASVREYDAETRRIAAMGGLDPEGLKLLVRQQVSEMLGMPALPAIAAHAHAEQAMMPAPPEQQAVQ